MEYIKTERVKEILKTYESGKHDLFNWCEEYKNFISSCVCACVSSEVDYILKKSYEDNDTPLSYEDLDLFDMDKAIEHIIYKFENEYYEEDLKIIFKETNEENNLKIKKIGDYEVYLKSLNKDTLKDVFDKLGFDLCEVETEVYEWWVISDPLRYRLQQQGKIFLNGGCCDFWGRCTTGQSISLDYCCIKAFIDLLKDRHI